MSALAILKTICHLTTLLKVVLVAEQGVMKQNQDTIATAEDFITSLVVISVRSTVIHCTVLFTILHCTVLYCTVGCTVCIVHCTALHCTGHSTALYCSRHSRYCSLYCTVYCSLYCTYNGAVLDVTDLFRTKQHSYEYIL